MLFIAVSLSVLAHVVFWWIVSLVMRRNDVADVWWWIGFIVVSAVALCLNPQSPALTLAAWCVTIWWTRLAWHIGRKVFAAGSHEDRRYAAMRERWWKSARVRSLLQVFVLQGLCMLPVVSPVLVLATGEPRDIGVFQVIAAAVFASWFAIEVVADSQMRAFRKNPDKKKGFLSTGLWRYSRHPNYFWESVVWLGIALLTVWQDFWYLCLVSPLFITFLLLRVSGVPLAEARRAHDPEYRAYTGQTSAFVPWFPKPGR